MVACWAILQEGWPLKHAWHWTWKWDFYKVGLQPLFDWSPARRRQPIWHAPKDAIHLFSSNKKIVTPKQQQKDAHRGEGWWRLVVIFCKSSTFIIKNMEVIIGWSRSLDRTCKRWMERNVGNVGGSGSFWLHLNSLSLHLHQATGSLSWASGEVTNVRCLKKQTLRWIFFNAPSQKSPRRTYWREVKLLCFICGLNMECFLQLENRCCYWNWLFLHPEN